MWSSRRWIYCIQQLTFTYNKYLLIFPEVSQTGPYIEVNKSGIKGESQTSTLESMEWHGKAGQRNQCQNILSTIKIFGVICAFIYTEYLWWVVLLVSNKMKVRGQGHVKYSLRNVSFSQNRPIYHMTQLYLQIGLQGNMTWGRVYYLYTIHGIKEIEPPKIVFNSWMDKEN